MKRTALLSALALAVALPLTAQAQDQAPAQPQAPAPAQAFTPGENFILTWDYDGDGKVALAEVLERRGDLFDSFDENGDGVLSAEELTAHDQMREIMQANEIRPDWAGQGPQQGQMQQQGWGPQGQQGGWGRGGQQGGWGNGGPGMMQQGWGPQGPQGGWGNGPQGWGNGGPGMMQQQPGWGQGYGPQGPQGGWGNGGPGMMQQQGWGQGFGRQGGRGNGGPGMMQQGMGPQGMGGGQQMSAAGLDTNGDGSITRDEFVGQGNGWFAMFDRDGNGEVLPGDFGNGRW